MQLSFSKTNAFLGPAPCFQEYFALTSLNFNLWLVGAALSLGRAGVESDSVRRLFQLPEQERGTHHRRSIPAGCADELHRQEQVFCGPWRCCTPSVLIEPTSQFRG